MSLRVAALSDVGRERTLNEDTYRVAGQDDDWILLVCDGMGGHEGGELASEAAATSLLGTLSAPAPNPTAAIYDALLAANDAVFAEAARRGMPDMGSTAVVARVIGDKCWIGWVGDSRFYHLRDGVRMAGSEDHTHVAEMVRHGILTPAQARAHPNAHVLTQALGGGGREPIKPSAWNEPVELLPGDVLLLCSDGLYDLLTDEEIVALATGAGPSAAAQRLVDAANAAGGHDNVTVIVAVVGGAPGSGDGLPAEGEAAALGVPRRVGVVHGSEDTIPEVGAPGPRGRGRRGDGEASPPAEAPQRSASAAEEPDLAPSPRLRGEGGRRPDEGSRGPAPASAVAALPGGLPPPLTLALLLALAFLAGSLATVALSRCADAPAGAPAEAPPPPPPPPT